MFDQYLNTFFQYYGSVRAFLPVAAAILLLALLRRKLAFAGRLLLLLAGMAVLFFNPLSQAAWRRMIESHVYWRTGWLLPSTVVIAYVLTELVWMGSGGMRVLALAAGSAAVLAGGSCMYSAKDGYFTRAANVYKLPETSCKIARYLVEETGGTLALVPDSLYCYLRQYSAAIDLVYGRNIAGYTSPVLSKSLHKLHGLMWNEPYKVGKILKRAKKRGCEIVIFRSDWEKKGDPKQYGYEFLTEIGGYEIYEAKTDIP